MTESRISETHSTAIYNKVPADLIQAADSTITDVKRCLERSLRQGYTEGQVTEAFRIQFSAIFGSTTVPMFKVQSNEEQKGTTYIAKGLTSKDIVDIIGTGLVGPFADLEGAIKKSYLDGVELDAIYNAIVYKFSESGLYKLDVTEALSLGYKNAKLYIALKFGEA
jgi:hypothetical protein